MAKKEEEIKDDFEDLKDIDDGEIKSVYPKMEKGKKKDTINDLGLVEDEEEEEIEEPIVDEGPKYKYLNLEILKKEGDNNYEIYIDGQSHGFLSVFVTHLLDLEGVTLAAYKKNNVEPPMIFLKLEDGFKIKDILRKGINNLREEVVNVQKVFKNLM